jgi:ABC-2 type transport system permease protein
MSPEVNAMKREVNLILALIRQEAYLTRRSLEIFVDIFFFPMMNVILFGLITSFIGGSAQARNAGFLMIGVLLWEVISINQYNVTVSSLWSLWSHNLTNIFIAPVSIVDYLLSHVVAALVRTALVVTLLAVGTYLAFGFNLLKIGWPNLLLFSLNLSLFGWWIGIILLGLIFRFGTRVQAISWGSLFLFQPLTAAFFPVHVLPVWIQHISYLLPATYVFEAARAALSNPAVDVKSFLIAFGMNLVYFVIAIFVFDRLFRRSKEVGQFARNDL